MVDRDFMTTLKEMLPQNTSRDATLFYEFGDFPCVRIERFDYLKVPALVGGGTSFPYFIERKVREFDTGRVLPHELARMFHITGENRLLWKENVYWKSHNPYKNDNRAPSEVQKAQWYLSGKDVTQAVWGALSSDPFQKTLQTLEESLSELITREKIMDLPGFKPHSFGGYDDVTLYLSRWANHPILDNARKSNLRVRACDLEIIGGSKTEGRSTSYDIRQNIAFILYEGFLFK